MQIRFGQLILAAMLIASAPLSAQVMRKARIPQDHICQNYLNLQSYELSKVFGGPSEPVWTLKPELGSIEEEMPGTAAQLVDIRLDLFGAKKRLSQQEVMPPDAAAKLIDRVIAKLVALQLRNPEPRLHVVIDSVLPFFRAQKSRIQTAPSMDATVTQTASKLWELTMACFFDGEEIYLGQTVAMLFPSEYKSSTKGPQWTREIDIAIKNWNGTWHWIEVKDWGQQISLHPQTKRDLKAQSLGQNYSRYLLRHHEIDLSLVLKYGIPEKDLEYYRDELHFDQILFAFPAGLPNIKP